MKVPDDVASFCAMGETLKSQTVWDFPDICRKRRRWISLITNPLNCLAPVPLSQIIGKISDRRLANIRHIGKIWDGRQKVKSPIVWDLSSDIRKPGLSINIFGHLVLLYTGGMEPTIRQNFPFCASVRVYAFVVDAPTNVFASA